MKNRFLSTAFVLIGLALSFTSELSRADDGPNPNDPSDPRNGNSLPDDAIGIVNLNDQDFSVALRTCLKHKTLAQCLKKEVGDTATQQPPQSTTDKVVNTVDEGLVGEWRAALQNMISYGQNIWQNNGGLAVSAGFQVGGNRIDMDEIESDPNKLATEAKLKNDGVWVKHEFELYPGIGYGVTAGQLGQPNASNGFYGGMVNWNLWMRITKRHLMDQTYNKNFWGFSKQDFKIMGQAFPMYFTIGSHMNGQDFLPGEGIEFERYGVIQLELGPNFTLLTSPWPSFATIGVADTVGVSGSWIFGHFKTTMEVQTDGKLRLTLENLDQVTAKLQAQLNAGVLFGPLNYIYNLVDLETGIVHSSETVLDLVVDPKFPEAIKELHRAYLGVFSGLQDLAASADKNYQGVRDFAKTNIKESTHERDFKFFTYEKGSSTAEAKIDTKFLDSATSSPSPSPSPSASPAGQLESNLTLDSMNDQRSTLKSDNNLLLYVSTDNANPDPLTNRSLSVKYRFNTKDAKPEEVKQFLDLARILAPADTQSQVTDMYNTLTTDHPNDKRGGFHGYFYINFDPKTVAELLSVPTDNKKKDLMVAWAKALELPNPETWGTMTTDQQDQAVAHLPDVADHLKKLRKFMSQILAAVQNQDPLGQARTMVSALRGDGFDLYPIAALAVPADKTHVMALERITFDASKKVLEYANIGDNYVYPKRALHD